MINIQKEIEVAQARRKKRIIKVITTLFAILGWFVTPISLELSLFIWAYSLVAFFITDLIKFYFYKSLDQNK